MKPIPIPTRAKAVNELLKKARRRRSVVLEAADGQRYVLTAVGDWQGFDVGNSEDFGEEVKRTVQNKRLMKFLTERRKTAKGKSKSLEEVKEGIHWPDLDEDLSVEGLIFGRPSGESQRSLQRWLEKRATKSKRRQV